MKFTLEWLFAHLDSDASLDTIVAKLSAIGLEVEGVEDPAAALAPFLVARIVSAVPHPQADKLRLLSVDAGGAEPFQVVCGAPNARAGLIGVFGPPGAYVPGAGFELKPATIRGVESFGMMCSEAELQLGEGHDGIIELPADAPVGSAYVRYAVLDAAVIEVSVTPNRQDCMGVRGIARDLAAAGLGTLRPLDQVYALPATPAAKGPAPDVRTEDAAGCPAFFAQDVHRVTNGSAPDWMARRLAAVGQKPISALVDITNYVMLDLGRPLHVYDKARLSGGLVARRAREGETVEALNGRTYTLDTTMTVIADAVAVHDIGGIMGGSHSGVSADTRDVLIECAYFRPESIARTGQALGLTSDARQRFERGVDPAFLDDGLAIATRLVTALCGGTPSAITRAGEAPADARIVAYDPALCKALGGIAVDPGEQAAILDRLGFAVQPGASWQVTVPSWRRDVAGAPDIVEEIIRIVGLDAVPSTPLPRDPGVARPTATPAQRLERRLRRTAAARGHAEAITWSFLPEKEAAAFGGGDWVLTNPISEDLKVMRPSLIPGLLSAARRNVDRGMASVRLFEVGRRYFRRGDGSSDERATLGLLLAGERTPRDWRGGRAAPFDVFDAKAEVEALLAAAGVDVARLMVMDGAGAHFHPGQSATLRLGPKTVLAAFGTLHPVTLKAMGVKRGTYVAAEIFLDAIPASRDTGPARAAYTPPALQPVTRDFAFLIDAALPVADLVRAIRGSDKAAIADARLFDRFAGEGVPEGRLSVAIEVVLQPGERSFTEEELSATSGRIVAAAAKLGASLRG